MDQTIGHLTKSAAARPEASVHCSAREAAKQVWTIKDRGKSGGR
jgi:hypothetical protein